MNFRTNYYISNITNLFINTSVIESLDMKKHESSLFVHDTNHYLLNTIGSYENWMPRYKQIRRYETCLDMFETTDIICITEKIHGLNIRIGKKDRQLFVGNYNKIIENNNQNIYWRSLRTLHKRTGQTKLSYLKNNLSEKTILFGEIYGSEVRSLTYDRTLDIIFYDVMQDNRFMNFFEMHKFLHSLELNVVPTLYYGKFNLDKIQYYTKGLTMLGATHLREGVVIKTIDNKTHPIYGRKIVKLINFEFEI